MTGSVVIASEAKQSRGRASRGLSQVFPRPICRGVALYGTCIDATKKGRSYRLIGREVGLSKNTVAEIVKRRRATAAQTT
jgi:hypothetical protein